MAAKKHDGNKLKKRKQNPDVKNRTDSSASKKTEACKLRYPDGEIEETFQALEEST